MQILKWIKGLDQILYGFKEYLTIKLLPTEWNDRNKVNDNTTFCSDDVQIKRSLDERTFTLRMD